MTDTPWYKFWQWKRRALLAEAQVEELCKIFQEASGMTVDAYTAQRVAMMYMRRPGAVIITNIEVPR